MQYFLDILHQKVPKAGKEIPEYYRRALRTSEILLVIYFAACFFLYPLINGQWEWIPLTFIALTAYGLRAVRKHGVRVNLLIFALTVVGWVSWNVEHFGWNSGVQHFLTLQLILVFFNVYDRPLHKIIWMLCILAVRILLFSLSLSHPAVYSMGNDANTVYQTLNTVFFFLMLAGICIIFSTSIQDTERQLRIRNQSLHREAGTDPLTGLPNRRAMIETIEDYHTAGSDRGFSVAIADIDFFKQINDTCGHSAGDYTLVKLTELFTERSMGRYTVCRWGGEEFCFFMPGLNLDEAAALMNDLCFAVEGMKLEHDGREIAVTITAGVEEYDFASPLEELLDRADEKLYMGKNAGRNRVIA